MHRLVRLAAAAAAAAALLPAAAVRAQDGPKPLIIASTWLFNVRNGDTLNGREWSIKERIDHVHDVFAKYLGGQHGKITTKKWGERVHLYLNGDFVLAVSPDDARANGFKSAERLAPIWQAKLQHGFTESHVKSTGKR